MSAPLVVDPTDQLIDDPSMPACARGTARVLVAGLYRRTAPHVDAGRAGQWDKGQVLTVWAEQGEWVLVQDLQTNTVAWSHRGTAANPYLELKIGSPEETP